MKKYNLDNLVVITVCSNNEIFSKEKLICERCFNPFKNSKSKTQHFFREIFTKQPIPLSNIKDGNNFKDYISKISNFKINDKIKLTKIELLNYYNKINKLDELNNFNEELILDCFELKKKVKINKKI